MESSALINDFIEGYLDGESENKLFTELNHNYDLREEFRNSLKTEKGLFADVSSVRPSASTTAGVFNKVGIPLAGAAAGAASTGGFLALASKYSQGLIGALVSSALTVATVLMITGNSSPQNDGDHRFLASAPTYKQTESADSAAKGTVPLISSTAESEDKESGEKSKIIYKTLHQVVRDTVYPDDPELLRQLLAEAESNRNISLEKLISSATALNSPRGESKAKSFSQINSEFGYQPIFMTNPINSNTFEDFAIEINNSEYIQLQGEDFDPSTNPLFENLSLSLIYELSPSWQIGGNIRNENFFQQYNGWGENDTYWLYRQNTNYLTAGVFARLKLFDFSEIRNIGEMYLGGNQAGPVVRLKYGILWQPSDFVTLTGGIEASSLIYHHQDIRGNTSYESAFKIGFLYGIQFNF